MKRLLLLIALLLTAAPAAAQDSTVIVLVRHAEKAAIAGESDPPLSAAGEARARALADTLRSWGVDAVVTTQFKRTGATAAPLVASIGVTPRVVDARAADHVAQVAAAARSAGRVVLVVGHSNTVPGIIGALSGPALPELCETEYANLFILVLKDGAAPRLERRAYGEPDPAGAASCHYE